MAGHAGDCPWPADGSPGCHHCECGAAADRNGAPCGVSNQYLDRDGLRIASRKICLCPLHQTTSTRSGFYLCNKITPWLTYLCTTNGNCSFTCTEADCS